jgi:GntR family transcriptional regulator/MocR family aminotransferase
MSNSIPWKRRRAAAYIRAQVADGTLAPGAAAPRAEALARATGYGTVTCRGALDMLVTEGVLAAGASPHARRRVPLTHPRAAPDPATAEAARALSRALAAARKHHGLTQRAISGPATRRKGDRA